MNPMNGSRTRVVLARLEYSAAIYRAVYTGRFKPGMKQVEFAKLMKRVGSVTISF